MQEENNKKTEKSVLHPSMEGHKFKKGCIPWNKGKKIAQKDSSKTQKEANKKTADDNTVEIKIVKESKPFPQREFEGKLDDLKERTAINFIKSVVSNKPDSINIDGLMFFSSREMFEVVDERNSYRHLLEKAIKGLQKAMPIMDGMEAEITRLRKKLKIRNRLLNLAYVVGLTISAFLAWKGIMFISR